MYESSLLVKMIQVVKRVSMSAKAGIQIFFHLTFPIRLAYALNQAQYFIACDDEACEHHGEMPSNTWQSWLAIKGYLTGFTKKEVPQWFIETWFGKQPLPV